MKPETKKKNPGGRPRKGDRERSGHLHLRCDPVRKGRYQRAAAERLQTLADWTLEACDERLQKQQP